MLTGDGDFIFQFDIRKLDQLSQKRMNLKMIFERLGVPTNATWPNIEQSAIY